MKMTVTFKQYLEDKKAFFEKHKYDYRVETSSLDEGDRYHKTYSFNDGAKWSETMEPTYEQVEIEIKKVKVKVDIPLYRTEYLNTEQGSNYYYEKY